jgi:short-subunit dehydrogenase involved in D-alanine esterification of teichoic acids
VFEVLPPLVESAMTAGRGRGKISPAQLADEFWAGYQADRYEMLIGKVKLLAWMRRMSPAFTDRTMRPPG